MRRIIITAIAAAMALTAAGCSDSTDTDRPTFNPLPACEMEDGSTNTTPCMWDAETQGNGAGESVIVVPTPQCGSDAECAEMYGAGGYGTTPSK